MQSFLNAAGTWTENVLWLDETKVTFTLFPIVPGMHVTCLHVLGFFSLKEQLNRWYAK